MKTFEFLFFRIFHAVIVFLFIIKLSIMVLYVTVAEVIFIRIFYVLSS